MNIRLGVNIDHVATVRNARGGRHPDPVRAALLAIQAGADGITAHLREDRRHISDKDIEALTQKLTVPLNLEMAATQEMLQIAKRHKPHAVCLVPEKREEKTTEGGLNLTESYNNFFDFAQEIFEIGSRLSLFLDPSLEQVDLAYSLKVPVVEIHTGAFVHAILEKNPAKIDYEYTLLKEAIHYGHQKGIEMHVGHGLTFDTVPEVLKIGHITELNIGHFLIGEAIFIGLEKAIHKMKKIIISASL